MDSWFDMFGNEIVVNFVKWFVNVSLVIYYLLLLRFIQELVLLCVSQINGCGWCVDMHMKEVLVVGESVVCINLVVVWCESIVFIEVEQVVLVFVEEGMCFVDVDFGVFDEIWVQVCKYYDDDQIVVLVCLVLMINVVNWFVVIVYQKGGLYEFGMFADWII